MPETPLQAYSNFVEAITAACQTYAEDTLRLTGKIPRRRPEDILSIGDKETGGYRYGVAVRFEWKERS